MTTKIPAELSSTPGIVDNSDATAITIASDEKVGIGETSPQFQMLTVKSSSATGNNLRLVTGSELAVLSVDDAGDLQINAHGADERIKFLNGVGSGTLLAAFDSDGLKFGSDTAAANALDDYEEGSYTPTSGASLTVTTANYTKIGRLVFLNGDITVGSTAGSSSFAMTLPFAGEDGYYSGLVQYNNVPEPQLAVNITTTQLHFRKLDTSFGFLNYTGVSGHRFIFSIVYTTAS